jgi:hypothetical protein
LTKRYPFFILDFGFKRQKKKAKKSKSPHPPMKKIDILDGTKHTHKNFGILHFIIPKYWHFVFCIIWGLNTALSGFPEVELLICYY